MDCDILIKMGRLFDGTGAKALSCDVAIDGGRIVALGASASEVNPRLVFDAGGLAVAPGFIDAHTHAGFMLASKQHHSAMEPFVRQGITTVVAGNCGFSPAPVNRSFVDDVASYWDCILPRDGLSWAWASMAELFDHLESVGPLVNIAQLVGHGIIRINTMGYDRSPASPEQLKAMRAQVRTALEEGAIGLSYGLGYVPGVWADTDELIEVGRDLPEFGGRITVHLRGQTVFMENSVREMIRVAETIGVPLQISHFVPYDPDYADCFFKAYEATEEARNRGMEIGYDLLAYGVASTTICMIYPPWMFEGGMQAFLDRLADVKVRARVIDEIKHWEPKWPTWETGMWPDHRYDDEVGWSDCRLHGFRKPEFQKYDGLNLEAIAEDMDKDPFDALFDLTLDEGARLFFTSGSHDDDGLDNAMGVFLRLPNMSFMTDAVGIGHGARHPSHYGSYARFLGKHVREWETFTLEEAVKKSTSLPAAQLGLKDRGVIREGAHADIVIFDPERIIDRSSFAEPYQYSEGIETVIINGVPVWHEGRFHADAPPGQVIRRS
jgi:N-acyl-D-amino-acid deacylase